MLTFSFLIWGHGERPARAFLAALSVIFLSAFLYTFGRFFGDGAAFSPNFFKALYFSVVTFTTVGYGDVTALGLNKLIAMAEAFSGIFLMPLFIVALSRKYLRV